MSGSGACVILLETSLQTLTLPVGLLHVTTIIESGRCCFCNDVGHDVTGPCYNFVCM